MYGVMIWCSTPSFVTSVLVDGPFANFSGYVDEVLVEKEKLRVMVHVFGRATPVVLDYTNVEKS